MDNSRIKTVLDRRDELLRNQQELYATTIANINMRNRELLTNDFGTTLVQNCVQDVAGEVVRRYFNTGDYYITVDQMTRRIISFSYENDFDPLSGDENARKSVYNMTDSPNFSPFLKGIDEQNRVAQTKLFEKERVISSSGKERAQYKDAKLMKDGKDEYRENHGDRYDELTGINSEDFQLEVDHVQAAATATYNSRYISDPVVVDELKRFYNSSDNFQMLTKSANASKGDVRVYSDGKGTYSSIEIVARKKELTNMKRSDYQRAGLDSKSALKLAREDAAKEIAATYSDITFKASAQDVAKAVCDRWESSGGEAKANLQKSGHLDANGKVPQNVRVKLEADLRQSMNEESMKVLRGMSYSNVTKDAMKETGKGFTKIIIGQVIYYVLPPALFETQSILRKKDMTIDRFFKEIKHAGGRVIRYAKSKLGSMLKNIAGNTVSKFIKTFFDIIISTVRESVKRLLKVAKSLVLSLVQCVKIIADKNTSSVQKADAVTKILATSLTAVVLEILFEMTEKMLGLNDFITEPLQIIVSILVTNLVMLILQKADLFDVQYGLLVANMEQIFIEERQNYLDASQRALEEARAEMDFYMKDLEQQVSEIEASMNALDPYEDDVSIDLEKINQFFSIGVDFKSEWIYFCQPVY